MDDAPEPICDLSTGLTFYRQKRFDGGIRMGVELGQATIWESFTPGNEERDPSLLWFVDLRFDGAGVPTDVESVGSWLLSNGEVVEKGIAGFADRLRQVGADKDDYPLEWHEFPEANDGVLRKIVCSAIGRVDSRKLADILDNVRVHWSNRIKAMITEPLESSARG